MGLMRYRCLVLDHDDTTVNSTPCIHYPAFRAILERVRPGVEYSQEEFLTKNFAPGLGDLYTKELGFTPQEDLREQLEILRDAADDCEDAGKLLTEAENEVRLYESEMNAKGIGLSVEKNRSENMPADGGKGYGRRDAGQEKNGKETTASGTRMRNYRRQADEIHAALMRCREKRADCGREMEELREEYEEWEYSMQCLKTMKTQQEAESVRYQAASRPPSKERITAASDGTALRSGK